MLFPSKDDMLATREGVWTNKRKAQEKAPAFRHGESEPAAASIPVRVLRLLFDPDDDNRNYQFNKKGL